MRVFAAICVGGVLALMMTGCMAPDTHDADVKAIKDLEAQWNQDFKAKNLDKVLGYYTSDAALLGSNAPIANTSDARRAADKQMMDDPNFQLQFVATKVEVAKSGDVGYTEGSYMMTMTDPATKQPMTDKGKYVTIYKKQADGSWKAVEDIQNSDMPLPAPPAAAPTMMKK